MRNSTRARLLVLFSVLAASSHGGSFFEPYSTSYFASFQQSEQIYIEKAMAALQARIQLAHKRVETARPKLAKHAARLEQIGEGLHANGSENAALFYAEAGRVLRDLPERFRLVGWLDQVEQERVRLLQRSEQLVVPHVKEGDKVAEAQRDAVLDARHKMYISWHQVMERLQREPAHYFAPHRLASQEAFEDGLFKSAIPLCDLGQKKPSGLELIQLDGESRKFLHGGRDSYFLNYSFLFASLSPIWPLVGDPASATLLEWEHEKSTRVEVGYASPYFNLFADQQLIAAMLDGHFTHRPLEVQLIFRPWNYFHIGTGPTYSSRRHRLTTYYGPYKGDWGSTRWEPASSDYDCARLLANKLNPDKPWNRAMTEGEILAEALRAPK